MSRHAELDSGTVRPACLPETLVFKDGRQNRLEALFHYEKNEFRHTFHELLDESRAGSNVSRQEMIVALSDRYRAFRTAKEKEIKAKLSRLR